MTKRGHNNGNVDRMRSALTQQSGLTVREYAGMAQMTPAQANTALQWLLDRGEVGREPYLFKTKHGREIPSHRYFSTPLEVVPRVDVSKLPRVDAALLAQLWPVPARAAYSEGMEA